MRSDWVPLSASALVVGAMSLVFGSLLNPAEGGESAVGTLRVVEQDGGRWLGMAVMFFFASLALTLGLPALLSLFDRRGRRLGMLGVGVFTVGAIGTCGYAMLMVFLRALVEADALRPGALDDAARDTGLVYFLYVWIAGFYGGLLLVAIALLVARATPTWVPVLLIVFVALFPLASRLGYLGGAIQTLCLSVACTGIAMAAVTGASKRTIRSEPAF